MRALSILLMVSVILAGLSPAAPTAEDVTRPDDPVIGQPNNNRWPAGEAPPFAIDNNVNTNMTAL